MNSTESGPSDALEGTDPKREVDAVTRMEEITDMLGRPIHGMLHGASAAYVESEFEERLLYASTRERPNEPLASLMACSVLAYALTLPGHPLQRGNKFFIDSMRHGIARALRPLVARIGNDKSARLAVDVASELAAEASEGQLERVKWLMHFRPEHLLKGLGGTPSEVKELGPEIEVAVDAPWLLLDGREIHVRSGSRIRFDSGPGALLGNLLGAERVVRGRRASMSELRWAVDDASGNRLRISRGHAALLGPVRVGPVLARLLRRGPSCTRPHRRQA